MRGFLLQELLAIEVEKRGRLDREAAEAITKLQVILSGGLVVPQLWCALIRTFSLQACKEDHQRELCRLRRQLQVGQQVITVHRLCLTRLKYLLLELSVATAEE